MGSSRSRAVECAHVTVGRGWAGALAPKAAKGRGWRRRLLEATPGSARLASMQGSRNEACYSCCSPHFRTARAPGLVVTGKGWRALVQVLKICLLGLER